MVQRAREWMNESVFFCGLESGKPLLSLLYTLSGVYNNGEILTSICLTSESFSQLFLDSGSKQEES